MVGAPRSPAGRAGGGPGLGLADEGIVVNRSDPDDRRTAPDTAHFGDVTTRRLDRAGHGRALPPVRDAKDRDLTPRQLCDLDLLLNGAFSPLEGFMSASQYRRVPRDMRLPCGALWPIPVTLGVSEAFAADLDIGETIALRDAEGLLAAILDVEEIWRPEKDEEARAVYGTDDDAHPGVFHLFHRTIRFAWAAVSSDRSPSSTTTTARFATLRPTFANASASSGGGASSPSRPAIRCTVPMSSSRAPGTPERAKRTFSSIPSWDRPLPETSIASPGSAAMNGRWRISPNGPRP